MNTPVYKNGQWERPCTHCGYLKMAVRGTLAQCPRCRYAESLDPWKICPDCQGPLEQVRVLTVGSIRTGERRCNHCGFRATTESRIVYFQSRAGERKPGAHRHMRAMLEQKESPQEE